MMMTPEEYRTKRCPVDAKAGKCLADACALWRWRPHVSDETWTAAVIKAAKEIGDTGASAAKAAKHVSMNRAKYGLPVNPTHGWCGLGTRPE